MLLRRASRATMALVLTLLIAVGGLTFGQRASTSGHHLERFELADPGGGSGGGGHL